MKCWNRLYTMLSLHGWAARCFSLPTNSAEEAKKYLQNILMCDASRIFCVPGSSIAKGDGVTRSQFFLAGGKNLPSSKARENADGLV